MKKISAVAAIIERLLFFIMCISLLVLIINMMYRTPNALFGIAASIIIFLILVWKPLLKHIKTFKQSNFNFIAWGNTLLLADKKTLSDKLEGLLIFGSNKKKLLLLLISIAEFSAAVYFFTQTNKGIAWQMGTNHIFFPISILLTYMGYRHLFVWLKFGT